MTENDYMLDETQTTLGSLMCIWWLLDTGGIAGGFLSTQEIHVPKSDTLVIYTNSRRSGSFIKAQDGQSLSPSPSPGFLLDQKGTCVGTHMQDS